MEKDELIEKLRGFPQIKIAYETGLHFNTIGNFLKGKRCEYETFEKLKKFAENNQGGKG